MLLLVFILVLVLIISVFSETHAIGIWLVLMICHEYLVLNFGSELIRLPILAGLIVVATILGRRKWSGVPNSIMLLVIMLILLMTASALMGLEPSQSIAKLVQYSKGFVLAVFIAGTIKNNSQVRLLMIYCLAGILIGVFVTLVEHFTGAYDVISAQIQRTGQFTGDPNSTATLLLTGIPIVLYWSSRTDSLRLKFFLFAIIALIIFSITLTQSRGAFVVLILLLTLIYFRRPTLKASAVGIAIIFLGLVLAPVNYWDRMGTLVGREFSQDQSIESRGTFVKNGITIFLSNPVLGVGIGNFGKALVATAPSLNQKEDRVAHNMYLEFFVENGLFGGLLFLSLLSVAVLQSFKYDGRRLPQSPGFELGFCVSMSLMALLISGLFLSIGKDAFLWFFVGLGLSFYAMRRSRVRIDHMAF